MPVPQNYGSPGGQPSCFQRVKMGFVMGFCVGSVAGCIFGGASAFRAGYRGRELVQLLGKTVIQGGGTFGTFMAVGTGIRC